MKRREFFGVAACAAVWPLASRAQPTERRRVAIFDARTDATAESAYAPFRQRMQELGWSESSNIKFESRSAGGDLGRLPALAADLIALKPDVILTEGTTTTEVLRKATRTIPVVFVNANDPLGSGFAEDLAHPGGNITGFPSFEPSIGGKWLQVLKEIAPGVSRAALLYNPRTQTGQQFSAIEAAASALGMTVVRAGYDSAADLEPVLSRIVGSGLIVLPDITNSQNRRAIIDLATRLQIPAIYPFRYYVDEGGLACYGTNRSDVLRQAASYVDRILRGEKPANLPMQVPSKLELAINLKAAKAAGITISPAMLARADEIVD